MKKTAAAWKAEADTARSRYDSALDDQTTIVERATSEGRATLSPEERERYDALALRLSPSSSRDTSSASP